MNEPLHHKHCVPCEGGVKPLTEAEIEPLLKNIKAWQVHTNTSISKKYSFVDFKHAITFVNEVADIAEFEGHHPDINVHGWNKVTITLSTHAIKGLSGNDFIMAAKIDQVLKDEEN
jgi:4a-hydroxytetrahydrobiopterin dehydratase